MYVTDTVNGILRIAQCDAAAGQEINIGTGHEISIGELASRITALVGPGLPVRDVAQRMRSNTSEVNRLMCNNAKARAIAGWIPQTSLDEGLALTIEWVRRNPAMYDPEAYRI